jgi:GDP-L-fucose synthase
VLAFGFGKRVQYAIAESYRKQHGVKSVNWIVCNPYGPEHHVNIDKMHALNGIIIRMIKAQRNNDTEFMIWGTGKPIREWLYIEDSANIMAYSVHHIEEQLWPVNVAQKRGYTITQIARLVAKALNYKVKFVYDTTKQDGAPIKIMDNALFKKTVPSFSFTPFQKGIETTVKHFKKLL